MPYGAMRNVIILGSGLDNRDNLSNIRRNVTILATRRSRFTNKSDNRLNNNNSLMLVLRMILRHLLLILSVNVRYIRSLLHLTLDELSSNGTMTLRRRNERKNNGVNMTTLKRIRRKRRRILSLVIRIVHQVTNTMTMLNNRLTILYQKRSRVVVVILNFPNVISSLNMIFKNNVFFTTTTNRRRRNATGDRRDNRGTFFRNHDSFHLAGTK